jgi:hypothetical protein
MKRLIYAYARGSLQTSTKADAALNPERDPKFRALMVEPKPEEAYHQRRPGKESRQSGDIFKSSISDLL